MFGIGTSELLIIMLIALLVFGSKRLPEIGTSIGKGIRQFQRSLNQVQRNNVTSASTPPAREAEEPKKLSQ